MAHTSLRRGSSSVPGLKCARRLLEPIDDLADDLAAVAFDHGPLRRGHRSDAGEEVVAVRVFERVGLTADQLFWPVSTVSVEPDASVCPCILNCSNMGTSSGAVR